LTDEEDPAAKRCPSGWKAADVKAVHIVRYYTTVEEPGTHTVVVIDLDD
jgi:hypothetical protein